MFFFAPVPYLLRSTARLFLVFFALDVLRAGFYHRESPIEDLVLLVPSVLCPCCIPLFQMLNTPKKETKNQIKKTFSLLSLFSSLFFLFSSPSALSSGRHVLGCEQRPVDQLQN